MKRFDVVKRFFCIITISAVVMCLPSVSGTVCHATLAEDSLQSIQVNAGAVQLVAVTDKAQGSKVADTIGASGDDAWRAAVSAAEWLKAQEEEVGNVGNPNGDWYIFGTSRMGLECDYRAYRKNIYAYIAKKYKEEGKLGVGRATEWHRISLALLAAGGDPTKVGGKGTQANVEAGKINLIADGVYMRGTENPLAEQGINGLAWGLIALDAMRYKVPDSAQTKRSDIISALLSAQLDGGGFSLNGKDAGADITAMVVTALAPYYNSEEKFAVKFSDGHAAHVRVRDSIDRALKYLSESQTTDGSFQLWGTSNAESTAQAVTALCSLGIDPADDKRFLKNGKSALDGLMKFVTADGGFEHISGGGSDVMATEHALYALVSAVRLKEHRRSLFDFRPEQPQTVKDQIDKTERGINNLPQKVDEDDRSEVLALYSEYLKVPPAERSYVYGYGILASAMETLGIENGSEYLSVVMDENTGGDGSIVDVPSGEDVGSRLAMSDQSADKAEAEVKQINSGILAELYPFDSIGIGDRKILDKYIVRIEKLDAAYKEKINGVSELYDARKRLDKQTMFLWIGVAVVLVGAAITAIFLIRKHRR